MTLHICGNSHVRALRGAAEDMKAEGLTADLVVFPLGTADNEEHPFSTVENGRVFLTNRRFRKKLKQFFGFTTFEPDQRWGLCLGDHHARIFHNPLWERAAPSWMNMKGMQPISEDLFTRIYENDQKHIYAFLEQLVETGVRPFVISSPWPVRQDVELTGIRTAPEIAKAIDTRARVLFAKWLSERGIEIVTPPAETADDDGMLKPEYAKGGDDPYHANFAYGRLMMRKVLEFDARQMGSGEPLSRSA